MYAIRSYYASRIRCVGRVRLAFHGRPSTAAALFRHRSDDRVVTPAFRIDDRHGRRIEMQFIRRKPDQHPRLLTQAGEQVEVVAVEGVAVLGKQRERTDDGKS